MSNVIDIEALFELSAQLDAVKETLASIKEKNILAQEDIDNILFILEKDKRSIFVPFYKARKGLVARGEIHPDVLVARAALSLQRVLIASQMFQNMGEKMSVNVTEGNVDEFSKTVSITAKDQLLQPDELTYFQSAGAYSYTTDPVKSLIGRFREGFIGFAQNIDPDASERAKFEAVCSQAQGLVEESALHHNL